MRRYLIAFLLTLSSLAQGQRTIVSSTNLQDAAGNVITNATISFTPVNGQGQAMSFRVGGAGGQVIARAVTAPVTNGAFSLDLADTSLTLPANVCYQATVTDNLTGNVLLSQGYGCVQPTGQAWSFDAYQPNLPGLLPVQYGPAGTGASITGVQITPLPVGGTPSVHNDGTTTNALLHFYLPQGVAGTVTATGTNGGFTVPGVLTVGTPGGSIAEQSPLAGSVPTTQQAINNNFIRMTDFMFCDGSTPDDVGAGKFLAAVVNQGAVGIGPPGGTCIINHPIRFPMPSTNPKSSGQYPRIDFNGTIWILNGVSTQPCTPGTGGLFQVSEMQFELINGGFIWTNPANDCIINFSAPTLNVTGYNANGTTATMTAVNSLSVGERLTLSGFTNGTAFNGVLATVVSQTPTSFTFNSTIPAQTGTESAAVAMSGDGYIQHALLDNFHIDGPPASPIGPNATGPIGFYTHRSGQIKIEKSEIYYGLRNSYVADGDQQDITQIEQTNFGNTVTGDYNIKISGPQAVDINTNNFEVSGVQIIGLNPGDYGSVSVHGNWLGDGCGHSWSFITPPAGSMYDNFSDIGGVNPAGQSCESVQDHVTKTGSQPFAILHNQLYGGRNGIVCQTCTIDSNQILAGAVGVQTAASTLTNNQVSANIAYQFSGGGNSYLSSAGLYLSGSNAAYIDANNQTNNLIVAPGGIVINLASANTLIDPANGITTPSLHAGTVSATSEAISTTSNTAVPIWLKAAQLPGEINVNNGGDAGCGYFTAGGEVDLTQRSFISLCGYGSPNITLGQGANVFQQFTGGAPTFPQIKANSGTRYLCIDQNGVVSSSTTACSGT